MGPLIDWYNVQFYSQGTAYTTCGTLVNASGDPFPATSLLEVVVLNTSAGASASAGTGGAGVECGWGEVVLDRPRRPRMWGCQREVARARAPDRC